MNSLGERVFSLGEWGITGSSKVSKIKEFVNAFEEKGIPWMYWQVTQPGAGDKDFEVRSPTILSFSVYLFGFRASGMTSTDRESDLSRFGQVNLLGEL